MPKKKSSKTKSKRKIVEILTMEQIFKVLNRVQLDNKTITVTDEQLYPTILNIINDSNVNFNETTYYKKKIIELSPNEEAFDREIDIDEIADEIDFSALF